MRCVITRVLPEPAPARISRGPSRCCTASHCGGLSCACQAASITASSVPLMALAKLTAPVVGNIPRQTGGVSCRAHVCVSTHKHPLLQQGFEICQFGVGVDPQNLLGIGHSDVRHTVLLGHCDRDHIREVLLSLR